MRTRTGILVVALATAVAACSDSSKSTAANAAETVAVADAFVSTPAGYDQVTSSYSADTVPAPFQPQFSDSGGPGAPHGPHGPGGPPPAPGLGGPGFGVGLMGGGLGGPFLGGGLDAGFGRGPMSNGSLPPSCVYSANTGIVTCPSETVNGLTVLRSASYENAAGTAQSKVDSTTNTISTQISVSGTVTRPDSSTSSVQESSSQTITGLAKGSASRTVNGASSGTESSSGTSPNGAFTSARSIGDTTIGLVLPDPPAGGPTAGSAALYPTAGTVIRAMQLTVVPAGQTPITSSRREVVTYNGTATASVVITQDSVTQNCTMPLPNGRLACQ